MILITISKTQKKKTDINMKQHVFFIKLCIYIHLFPVNIFLLIYLIQMNDKLVRLVL